VDLASKRAARHYFGADRAAPRPNARGRKTTALNGFQDSWADARIRGAKGAGTLTVGSSDGDLVNARVYFIADVACCALDSGFAALDYVAGVPIREFDRAEAEGFLAKTTDHAQRKVRGIV